MPHTSIDPRAVWPLAYLSGRLGWRLAGYHVDGPGKDVISVDLERSDVRVRVDWFPRTGETLVSQGLSLIAVCATFAELCDALDGDLVGAEPRGSERSGRDSNPRTP